MRTFRENEPLLQAITAPVLNEMARAVNRVGELDRVTLGGFGSEIVATVVRVSSSVAIPAFAPVQFLASTSAAADDALSAAEAVKPVLAVEPWAEGDEGRAWAIMLEPVTSGGVARAIMTGIVTCKVKLADGHGYAAPAVGKIASTADVTSAKIISASTEADEDGLVWATLLIGAASFAGWPQWGCSVVAGEESFSLRVRSGSLAWGGGHYAVWPSGNAVSRDLFEDIELAVPVGDTHFVVWSTSAPPVPLRYCPKKPSTNATCAECDACGTVGAAGDPDNFTPDTGSVSIVATPERADGWTDFRVLATVECTAEGVYRVVQIQTAEITVNAIVREEGGTEDPPPPEEQDPPCGHPGNASGGGGDTEHPADPDEDGETGGQDGDWDHPGDSAGEDGVTPDCGETIEE